MHNQKTMNLDGIDVFVKVIQTGSFTAAAKQLKMPTTTVSSKVAQLEKRLGVTLIQRTTRKLNLTQAGTSFFQRCSLALEEIEAGESELNATKLEPEGVLKISSVAELGRSILPNIVRGYLKAYPKMKVELILTNRLVDLVGEKIDLAVRFGSLKDSSLVAKKILNTEISLWASPAYLKKFGTPKNAKDLKKHQFVRYSALPETLKISNSDEAAELQVVGRVSVDDLETMKSFVLGGDGIGIMPDFIGENENGKLIRVLPEWSWGKTPLSFVYPPQRFVSLKVQSFIAWTMQHADEIKKY